MSPANCVVIASREVRPTRQSQASHKEAEYYGLSNSEIAALRSQ